MTKKKKPHTLFVFDIDGTLCDSAKEYQQSFQKSLMQLGVQRMNSDFDAYKHHTDSYIARIIYEKQTGNIWSTALSSDLDALLLENYKRDFEVREIPGANKILHQVMMSESYAVCFATGAMRRSALHKLDQIGIEIEDELLVTSNDLEEREQIVLQAIHNAEVYHGVNTFQRIISVGDGVWDWHAAQALNLEFVGVGERNKDKLKKLGAQLVLDDLIQFDKHFPLT